MISTLKTGFVLVVATALLLTGCRKEEDTDTPFSTSASINLENNSGIITVPAGTSMTVKASFEDEVALDLYTLNVTAAFEASVGTPFSFETQGQLQNVSDQIQVVVDIPADAIAGPYLVAIAAVDAAGNISAPVEFVVAITNAQQAAITITDPDPNTTAIVGLGDILELSGNVSHSSDIVTVDIVLEPAQQEGGLVAASGPIYDTTFGFDEDDDTSWDFDQMADLGAAIEIPVDAQIGPYHLTISAETDDGNIAILQMDVQVEW